MLAGLVPSNMSNLWPIQTQGCEWNTMEIVIFQWTAVTVPVTSGLSPHHITPSAFCVVVAKLSLHTTEREYTFLLIQIYTAFLFKTPLPPSLPR